ncbi:hypothetical protein Tco_0727401 [Tanacetum coccineum]|uniref:Uncharacterized protein n=1 Tax=Tanacetum coccineum TaxID=301880 RepID=A0ABQ4YIV2_9ASTR
MKMAKKTKMPSCAQHMIALDDDVIVIEDSDDGVDLFEWEGVSFWDEDNNNNNNNEICADGAIVAEEIVDVGAYEGPNIGLPVNERVKRTNIPRVKITGKRRLYRIVDEDEDDEDIYGHPAATYICTNEGPDAPHTSTNDVIVNDPNKGKAIMDTELAVVETHVNDFTYDESSSLPEHASDVNKVVCPPSSPTIESDEMPTYGDVDNMRMCVDEAATNQHVTLCKMIKLNTRLTANNSY